jgi:hypothetical protein
MSARTPKVAFLSSGWRIWFVSATIVTSLQFALVGQASEVERVGPRAFTDRTNEKTMRRNTWPLRLLPKTAISGCCLRAASRISRHH